eukprot:5036805-Amphidinium_carterae.1
MYHSAPNAPPPASGYPESSSPPPETSGEDIHNLIIRVGVLDEGVLNSHPCCIATRQKDRAVRRREDLRCQLTRK